MGLAAIGMANVFLFQNCSPNVHFSQKDAGEFGSLSANQDDGSGRQCVFNGQLLNEGESVSAYSASSVPFGSECISELRKCGNGILSGSFEAKSCQVLPKDTANLCSKVSQVVGDMRTEVVVAASAQDYSILEFGTFADNYWVGNPETFDRKLEFFVDNPNEVSEFKLVQAAFDDWLAVSVNGVSVYYGPKTDVMTKLVVDLNTKKVEYADGLFSVAELSTSWNKTLSIDIKQHLIAGKNTVKVRTVVAGAGECFLKFKYKTTCQ